MKKPEDKKDEKVEETQKKKEKKHHVQSTSDIGEKMKQKYPQVCTGIGKLKNYQVKLHIKEDVKPVAQKTRRLPFALREKESKQLDQLEKDDIIEKVEGPTPWVSALVVPKGNSDEVRLCTDRRQANLAKGGNDTRYLLKMKSFKR